MYYNSNYQTILAKSQVASEQIEFSGTSVENVAAESSQNGN